MDFNPLALPTSQPAINSTPAPSIDSVAQLESLRQQRMGGKIDQPQFLREIERLAPLVGNPAAQATPISQELAVAKIAELKQQRLDGKIGQREFLAQMESLGPQAAGESPSDVPNVHFSPQVQAEIDRTMMPPPDPASYKFEYDSGYESTPESLAWDAQIRSTFHKLGVPQIIAAPLFAATNRAEQRFAQADDAEIMKAAETTATQLRTLWGTAFDAKIAAVVALIENIPGEVGETIRAQPWVLFTDVSAMTALDFFAHHRAQKRR